MDVAIAVAIFGVASVIGVNAAAVFAVPDLE